MIGPRRQGTWRHVALAGGPVQLAGPADRCLGAQQRFCVVEAPAPSGPWRAIITDSYFSLDAGDGREVVAYHWHPGPRQFTFPHLHLRSGAQVRGTEFEQVHLPTAQIAIAALLRFAITELGVQPRRSDWQDVLRHAREAFRSPG